MVTGDVRRSSSVPVFLSSEKLRMVIIGTTKSVMTLMLENSGRMIMWFTFIGGAG